MTKIIIRIVAVIVILVAAMLAYFILSEPDIPAPPPAPVVTSQASASGGETQETADETFAMSEESSEMATTDETAMTADETSTMSEETSEMAATDETSTMSEETSEMATGDESSTMTEETSEMATTDETATMSEETSEPASTMQEGDDAQAMETQHASNTLVIEVGGGNEGTIEIELNADIAPNHVARIKKLAAAGAYDNIIFHRVIDGFMAQTGDVLYGEHGTDTTYAAGTGGSDEPNLQAEFSEESFTAGVVGMARASDPDSANSQFFIMFGDAPYLDGQYTVVGKVVAGMDVVNAIKKGDPNDNGSVRDPDFMKRVYIK